MPSDAGEHQCLLYVPIDKNKQMEKLEAKACQLFNEYKKTYGYRRLSDALTKAGMKSGHYQVRHLMARLGLKARYPKRFKVTTDSNHNELISPSSTVRCRFPKPSLDD